VNTLKNLEDRLSKLEGTLEFKDETRDYFLEEVDPEAYLATLSIESRRSVEATLARTRTGFSTDLVTPLIGKSTEDKDEARRFIRDHMLDAVTRDLGARMKPLLDAEVTQASKVGPLSIMLPFQQRKPDLLKYYCVPKVSSNFRYIEMAFERIKQRLPRNLKATNVDEAFKAMPRGTNLGAPFFKKSSDLYPELIRMTKMIEKDGYTSHQSKYPCLLYWRGQAAGFDKPVKQRAVWGYPHVISLHEERIMIPIIKEMKKLPEFAALVSDEAVNKEISTLLKHPNRKQSIDFSSFDQFARPMTGYVFDLIRGMFRKSDWRLIDYIQYEFENIPLLHPDGIWYGEHGVPSGAGPTNFCDSMVNWLIAEAFAIYKGIRLLKATFQGDDGVYLYSEDIDSNELIEFVRTLGMYVGFDKGGDNANVVLYLQNVHMSEYKVHGLNVGVRPMEKALSGMMGFETARDKTWRPVDTTLRWLQQVESLKYHVSFERAARLLYNNDRLLRQFNIRELISLAGGLSELEARQKDKSFPYGKEPLSNLANFAIVKVLDRMRKQLHGREDPRGDWWT